MEQNPASRNIVHPFAQSSPPTGAVIPPERERLLRMPEVESIVGLRKSSIYALLKAGKFVRPVRISPRCVAFPASQVQAWIQGQIAAADR